jgi:elongation factor 1-alpha
MERPPEPPSPTDVPIPTLAIDVANVKKAGIVERVVESSRPINIAVVGSVDAGKSTLIGVLKTGELDKGAGEARMHVLTMKHEKESGMTSNINVVRVDTYNLLDLAGHEKYLKTTLRGLTEYFPDYAMVVVSATKGVTRITQEHMVICRHLNIPVLVIVSKIDTCPEDRFKKTLDEINDLRRRMQYKFFYSIDNTDGANKLRTVWESGAHAVLPYFKVSNVSGEGVPLLKNLLQSLRPREDNHIKRSQHLRDFAEKNKITKVFFIHKTYFVEGTGLVVYGVNKLAPITKGEKLFIGPIGKEYYEVRIRSVHNSNRELIDALGTNQTGCFAIKTTDAKFKLEKNMIPAGRVVSDKPILVHKIKASALIFKHSTTITPGYSPFVHCGNVAVSAKIIDGSKFPLRTQDLSDIYFEFATPQFVHPGVKLIFREGGIRGVGLVTEVYFPEHSAEKKKT